MSQRLIRPALCLVASCGTALAGGLDRTGQPIGILFEQGGDSGGYLQLDVFRANPDVTGTGAGIAGFVAPGGSYANVAEMFYGVGGALKLRINDQLSAAFIAEQPYGSDLLYPGSGLDTELGGTLAWAHTASLTALLRYRINENWSLHGGLRYQEIKGDIRLSGWAYGAPKALGLPSANGYKVSLAKDGAWGYVLGASYEIPEIAFRATLTYNSEITHEMDTVESGNPSPAFDGRSVTEVKTPRSVNLDLQTGIASDTLLYGSIRWAEWSAFRIDPVGFVHPVEEGGGGVGLVELDDTVTYTIGLARRFSEDWSGSAEVFYEPRQDGVVAPLFPSVGFWGAGLGLRRDWENFSLSLGARYTRLGDGRVETLPAGTARANFEENDILSLGLRVGYKF
ncbi:OmpP1/FadL family transporter [Aliiruegeria lutimaris]|uniref:Long-chain fatty acid transport protein n=1 Tax=Aliiruegeria lutimaris TaxID=571298 RepID=A0A1G8IT86_9RHOB|nr:outer membrane protein transport protein [Aliiruegeria lutimaris]SDI21907.1 Long-chain fatty acid transport protein [Aliiruegeria lutimaris]